MPYAPITLPAPMRVEPNQFLSLEMYDQLTESVHLFATRGTKEV
jgi:hypothetical protein